MTANEKEMPKISIIVPVYNAAGTLDRCMRGLLAQTWRNLEILLMDDGSDDGSPALCDRYAAEDPRVRAVHLAHGGVAGARNAALSLYTGDFLMFADADDLVDIHYAEYLYDALLAGGTDLAYCHAFDCKDTPPDSYAIAVENGGHIMRVHVLDIESDNACLVILRAVTAVQLNKRQFPKFWQGIVQ